MIFKKTIVGRAIEIAGEKQWMMRWTPLQSGVMRQADKVVCNKQLSAK